MTTTDLDRLRERNALLERQLAAAGIAPAAPPDLPDPDEVGALLALVSRKYPVLQPAAGRAEEFRAALYYLAHARRRAEPDQGAMSSYWISGAERFLAERGWPSTSISVWPFAAAAVVSHVSYAPLTMFPHDLAWGLAVGEAAEPRARWRETLNTRRVPEPTKVERRAPAKPQELNVLGGNRYVGDQGGARY